jgi:hypothetical protein
MIGNGKCECQLKSEVARTLHQEKNLVGVRSCHDSDCGWQLVPVRWDWSLNMQVGQWDSRVDERGDGFASPLSVA